MFMWKNYSKVLVLMAVMLLLFGTAAQHKAEAQEPEQPNYFVYLKPGMRQYYVVSGEFFYIQFDLVTTIANNVSIYGYTVMRWNGVKYAWYDANGLAPGGSFTEIFTIPSVTRLEPVTLFVSSSMESKIFLGVIYINHLPYVWK